MIEAAFERRDEIAPGQRGEIYDAVEAALDLLHAHCFG
jgi:hypothetical protein